MRNQSTIAVLFAYSKYKYQNRLHPSIWDKLLFHYFSGIFAKTYDMKYVLLFVFAACLSTAGQAQDPQSAAKGVTYGAGTSAEGAISVNDLNGKLTDNKYNGRIQGKVSEVCQDKGCWMKIEKSDGEKVMVKFKDYKFFMPKDIVGKEVVLDGEASVKEVSVKQQQHYAKDAGKSDEEIKKIREPKKELQFVAKGVLVM
jgi:hypothetical protein